MFPIFYELQILSQGFVFIIEIWTKLLKILNDQ